MHIELKLIFNYNSPSIKLHCRPLGTTITKVISETVLYPSVTACNYPVGSLTADANFTEFPRPFGVHDVVDSLTFSFANGTRILYEPAYLSAEELTPMFRSHVGFDALSDPVKSRPMYCVTFDPPTETPAGESHFVRALYVNILPSNHTCMPPCKKNLAAQARQKFYYTCKGRKLTLPSHFSYLFCDGIRL